MFFSFWRETLRDVLCSLKIIDKDIVTFYMTQGTTKTFESRIRILYLLNLVQVLTVFLDKLIGITNETKYQTLVFLCVWGFIFITTKKLLLWEIRRDHGKDKETLTYLEACLEKRFLYRTAMFFCSTLFAMILLFFAVVMISKAENTVSLLLHLFGSILLLIYAFLVAVPTVSEYSVYAAVLKEKELT